MKDKFFLDTNVFVYANDQSDRAKADKAESLILEAIGEGTGVISYQVVQEFINVALRRFPKPLTAVQAEHYIANVFQPMLTVPSSQGLFLAALRTQARYQLSWHDALIVTAAIEAGCTLLYSEDLEDGQRFGDLRVRNPFA